MRKRLLMPFLIVLFLCFAPSIAEASTQSLQVTMPTFSVTLNGTQIDSSMREYPLIVYKNITYFPMTYYDCRYLGLETIWNSDTGLYINKTGVSGLYRDYRSTRTNPKYGTATMSNFSIVVNGMVIDNALEEYPLLLFRDVTYFPMTWRFCHDAFGWSYDFSETMGLVIHSDNPSVERLDIPLPDSVDRNLFGFLVDGDLYYAYGADRIVYQGSLQDPSHWREVYRFSEDEGSLGGVYADENKAYLRYHVGRATMGTDVIVQLHRDGTAEQVSIASGTHLYKDYGDVQISATQHMMFNLGGHNLTVRYGEGAYRPLGNPSCFYGSYVEITKGGISATSTSDLYRVGDDIYILACDMTKDEGSSGVYKVNLHTGETTCLIDGPVSRFIIEGEYVYYSTNGVENRLHRMQLSSGEIVSIAGPYQDSCITDFAVLGETLYFTMTNYWSHTDGAGFSGFYRADNSAYLYYNTSINAKAQASGMRRIGDFLAVTFEGYGNAGDIDDRFIVIDANGYIVFRTDDEVSLSTVCIVGDRLYYMDEGLRQIGTVALP